MLCPTHPSTCARPIELPHWHCPQPGNAVQGLRYSFSSCKDGFACCIAGIAYPQVTGFLRGFSFPERIRETRSRYRQFEFLHQEAVVSGGCAYVCMTSQSMRTQS
jgi:hypothetical protein